MSTPKMLPSFLGFVTMPGEESQFISMEKKKGIPENPLVSIITPILNGSKYLELCIQSVLNQTYPYIEHIFVDGGSTDGTIEILADYQVKYPNRIRFISEPDKGAVEAWNKGWDLARGEIFGWLGSDDVLEFDAIQTVLDFFRQNPGAFFIFGGCNYINEKSEIIERIITRDFNLKKIINGTSLCPIPNPSAFYKREIIYKIGYLDTSINAADFDYWIRVGKEFPIHRINKVLSSFRIHENSVSSKKAGKIYAREDFLISKRHGGGFFSSYAKRYYFLLLVGFLRPSLGFTYPFLSKVLKLKVLKIFIKLVK